MAGPKEAKLMQALSAQPEQLHQAAKSWKTAADGLEQVAKAINTAKAEIKAAWTGKDADAATAAFTSMVGNVRDTREKMVAASTSLNLAGDGLADAKTDYGNLPFVPAMPDPLEPGADTEQEVHYIKLAGQSRQAAANRETQAGQAYNQLNVTLQDARSEMSVAVPPPPTDDGKKTGAPTAPGGGTTPPGTVPTTYNPVSGGTVGGYSTSTSGTHVFAQAGHGPQLGHVISTDGGLVHPTVDGQVVSQTGGQSIGATADGIVGGNVPGGTGVSGLGTPGGSALPTGIAGGSPGSLAGGAVGGLTGVLGGAGGVLGALRAKAGTAASAVAGRVGGAAAPIGGVASRAGSAVGGASRASGATIGNTGTASAGALGAKPGTGGTPGSSAAGRSGMVPGGSGGGATGGAGASGTGGRAGSGGRLLSPNSTSAEAAGRGGRTSAMGSGGRGSAAAGQGGTHGGTTGARDQDKAAKRKSMIFEDDDAWLDDDESGPDVIR